MRLMFRTLRSIALPLVLFFSISSHAGKFVWSVEDKVKIRGDLLKFVYGEIIALKENQAQVRWWREGVKPIEEWVRLSTLELFNPSGPVPADTGYESPRGELEEEKKPKKNRKRKKQRVAVSGADLVEIGRKYKDGLDGYPEDEVKAVEYFKAAAEKNNLDGQFELGEMYFHGGGDLPEDRVQARIQYQLSAAQGHADAKAILGWMYQWSEGGLDKNEARAVELAQISVSQGSAFGKFVLGSMYASGFGGLPKDEKKAAKFYKASARGGNPNGRSALGRMYEEGLGGLSKNLFKAKKLYQEAGENCKKELAALKFLEKPVRIKKKDECPMCFHRFVGESKNVLVLRCGHRFHQPCIDEWEKRNPKCPICDAPIK